MLAAVPAFVQLHLRAIKHTVQSAQPLIVGVSETDPGVEDHRALRSFICRCLMKASIANRPSSTRSNRHPSDSHFVERGGAV